MTATMARTGIDALKVVLETPEPTPPWFSHASIEALLVITESVIVTADTKQTEIAGVEVRFEVVAVREGSLEVILLAVAAGAGAATAATKATIALVTLLETIRDWGPKQRLARAEATLREAQAVKATLEAKVAQDRNEAVLMLTAQERKRRLSDYNQLVELSSAELAPEGIEIKSTQHLLVGEAVEVIASQLRIVETIPWPPPG